MKLKKIKGSSFYIRGGTNTGVYLFNDKKALIIDPGLPGIRPKNIIRDLEKEDISINWIINTHEHNDHYGAGYQFKEKYPDLINMSSSYSKIYIDNPQLFSTYIMGGNTNKFLDNILISKNMKPVIIDKTIEPGKLNINGEDIHIINLSGHTKGSIGVLTKDKVIFLGDMLVGEDLLNKFDLLFIFDIKDYLESLDYLSSIDFEYAVLAHSKKEFTKDETLKLISRHRDLIYKYLNQIRNIIKEPKGLENILKIILNKNKLTYNYKEYHFFKSTLVSMISYLTEMEEIQYIVKDGEILYYTN